MAASCRPSVALVAYPKDVSVVAAAAKLTLSSRGINSIIENMDDREVHAWVRELVKRGHGSPLEHIYYGFEITCSRAASHQIVRHRIASYTQLSQRRGDKILRSVVMKICGIIGYMVPEKPASINDYQKYAIAIDKFLSYISRGALVDEAFEAVCEGFILPPRVVRERDHRFVRGILVSLRDYYRALANGYLPEDARFLLPNATKTRLYMTMNARELIEVFIPLRTCTRAQWEIRYIAWLVYRELLRIHRDLFKYTGPRCVFYENRIRMEPCSLADFLRGRCVFASERCPELVPRESIRSCILSGLQDPWDGKPVLDVGVMRRDPK